MRLSELRNFTTFFHRKPIRSLKAIVKPQKSSKRLLQGIGLMAGYPPLVPIQHTKVRPIVYLHS